jgi:hypothetical protein
MLLLPLPPLADSDLAEVLLLLMLLLLMLLLLMMLLLLIDVLLLLFMLFSVRFVSYDVRVNPEDEATAPSPGIVWPIPIDGFPPGLTSITGRGFGCTPSRAASVATGDVGTTFQVSAVEGSTMVTTTSIALVPSAAWGGGC